ncbi:1165_t:CDS:2 [Paraglomus occultum]|uniref:1165_t:CDS:1 n=1 Tax=Paraglomus occultum TaxID=144539 RepID=A0A9N9AUP5_9GLOM|nr:1165_t:CDS:2 [Paraglomus occultum]
MAVQKPLRKLKLKQTPLLKMAVQKPLLKLKRIQSPLLKMALPIAVFKMVMLVHKMQIAAVTFVMGLYALQVFPR